MAGILLSCTVWLVPLLVLLAAFSRYVFYSILVYPPRLKAAESPIRVRKSKEGG